MHIKLRIVAFNRSFVDCHDSRKFLGEMAGAESESSRMSLCEPMEVLSEIEERTLRIDSLYTPGNIYPAFLPEVVLDKIKKYHRLANAEITPRKLVNIELRRFNVYSQYLNRKLDKDTLSPSFVRNLKLIVKVLKYCTLIGGSELEYLTNILLELGTGAIQNDAAGLSIEFRDLP